MARSGADNDNRRRVLEVTDIVRLVGEHVTLKPKGREFACLCPFHNDHNPSMYVIPAKQIFHCFVCAAGGNAIDFIMRFHGMGFLDALELLANRAGIELTRTRRTAADTARHASTREQIIDANAEAMRFFRGILNHPEHGAAARQVIEQRGISPEMVEAFGLGAAPDRWDGLIRYAESRDIPLVPLFDAGLLKKRQESEGFYDSLRHRLIFPIHDRLGRPIAFGGRKIRDEDEPKYLNSPETQVFDKGSTLFGLKQALRSIQSERTAIVTEGYTDVIACHQHGFTNVVATLGTALTPKHASALRGICDTLILLFDGDEAGQRAADRALEVFFTEPVDLRIAVMEGGKDPDELLKKEGGREAFRAVIENAMDALAFRFERLNRRLIESGHEPGSNARAAAIESEIDRLVEIGLRRLPPIRQHTVITRLTRLAGVDASAVIAALGKVGVRPVTGAPPSSPSVRVRSTIEHLMGCLLIEPHLAESHPSEARDVLGEAAYSSPPIGTLARLFASSLEEGSLLTLADLLVEVEDAEVREKAALLASEVNRLTEGGHDRVAEHWRACLNRLSVERNGREASGGDSHESRLERVRRLHERTGGNPLAMPRPRVGAGPTL